MASSDEELVARSIGGDLDSFNQLVLRWERPIYALAYRVIGREEDARDVCQDTFLRAFRALGGFKGQAKFSSWLYRITLNLCRDCAETCTCCAKLTAHGSEFQFQTSAVTAEVCEACAQECERMAPHAGLLVRTRYPS